MKHQFYDYDFTKLKLTVLSVAIHTESELILPQRPFSTLEAG